MWGFATVTFSDLILSYSGPIIDYLNGRTWRKTSRGLDDDDDYSCSEGFTAAIYPGQPEGYIYYFNRV